VDLVGDRSGKPSTGHARVQYGGLPDMRRFAAVCLWALLLMATTMNAQEPQCPCDFEIVTKEIPANVELRLSAFQIKGLERRRAMKFFELTDLSSGMVIDTTHKWFREHIPCGIEKFCIVRVTFSHKHFGETAVGSVAMIMEVRRRKK
jgi:hypothetical protein